MELNKRVLDQSILHYYRYKEIMNVDHWKVFPKMKSVNVGKSFSTMKKQQIQTIHSKI